MDKRFAEHFANEWLDAWNAHDLDRILDHYADDFEMHSPAISQILGEPSGVLRGKDAVRGYWAKALAMMPELKFELQEFFWASIPSRFATQGFAAVWWLKCSVSG